MSLCTKQFLCVSDLNFCWHCTCLPIQLAKERPPQSYLELKTNREILTDRNKSSFRRYKLMKWWAQSFLVGVPKITCGFRNDDGVVKVLQTFKTSEIPHETQVRGVWSLYEEREKVHYVVDWSYINVWSFLTMFFLSLTHRLTWRCGSRLFASTSWMSYSLGSERQW